MLKRYHADARPATFVLLPAIDLRGGRIVRLVQGDFDQETDYGEEPAAVATRFVQEGATWLHVVDLDAAQAGEPRQLETLQAIAATVGERAIIEWAGGLRTDAAVDAALDAGADRIVVGTAALKDPSFAGRLIERLGPELVVVAIDVRDGFALGEGWRPGAPGLAAPEAVRRLADAGVDTFEVTSIARDGLLGGPDLQLLASIVELGRGTVLASGGIGRLEDLRAVRELGCGGAIVGRAVYEGRFTLAEALGTVAD